MIICVYGAASDLIAENFKVQTEELGKEIALRGHKLIFGGGATGLMGACSRGVLNNGGEAIGVVPKFMSDLRLINNNCTTLIKTETMAERKSIMEACADAFIITPGGIGTFDEFFQIMTLKELNRKNAPVVIFNIDNYYDDILKTIEGGIKKGFINPQIKDMLIVCDNIKDIFTYIE